MSPAPDLHPRRIPRAGKRARLAVLFVPLGLAACDMSDGGRIKPLESSVFFADRRASRDLVPGTVPREGASTAVTAMRLEFEHVRVLPLPPTRELLARGRQQFDIFCSVCHGKGGDGDGMIVLRGLSPPPSFHLERLRRASIGHFVDVMTNGYGAMFSYAERVTLPDRWAIAAYLRAIQLSRRADARMLRPGESEKAKGGGG